MASNTPWVSSIRLVLLCCSACYFFGCLLGCAISDSTGYEDAEGRIPDTFFSDIRRGKTTRQWIESQLGQPDHVQEGPAGKLISTYRLSRSQKKHAAVLIFFRYDGEQRDVEYFHVYYEHDIVGRHWRDGFSEVQTARYFGNKSNMASSDETQTDNLGTAEADPAQQSAPAHSPASSLSELPPTFIPPQQSDHAIEDLNKPSSSGGGAANNSDNNGLLPRTPVPSTSTPSHAEKKSAQSLWEASSAGQIRLF